jgi:hypothetical protein
LQNACEVTFEPTDGGPTQTCFGTEYCTETGWTGCTLPDELCNGLDDNCNGDVDETFKNDEGKYATAAHCGKCNRNCEQLSYENAVGICDVTLDEPDCTFACLPGFFDTNDNPGDGCECQKAGDIDYPNGQDVNCDGIDGEINNAIFVAKDGDDANPGTIEEPKLTIQAGLNAAEAEGKRDVYVATSVYSENITLKAGVSLYGGYSADFKQRNTLLYETAIIGTEPQNTERGTVNVVNITGDGELTYFDGFTVFGYNAEDAGSSSYTVYIRNADDRFVMSGNRVLSGNGGNGGAGTPGTDGGIGPAGTDGTNAYDLGVECGTLQKYSDGGLGGNHSCSGTDTSGGRGGHGFCPNYSTTSQSNEENGDPGKNGGGAGGSLGYDGVIAPPGGTGGGGGGGGSCTAATCGGIAGNCYCDSLCSFYNDCCANACSVCNVGCGSGGGGPNPPGSTCSTGNGCNSCLIAPDNLQMVGGDGGDGTTGSTGGSGGACQNSAGTVVNGEWIPPSGNDGGNGGNAGGGGGGGAGNGTQTCSCSSLMSGADIGGTGGGGGAGGCGGTGGTGGTGAGGSFAVFMVFDTPPIAAPVLENNVIRRGGGGFGGPGGNGGVGGVGGIGGKGGEDGSGAINTFCAGKGGNGGKGGDGGHGGGGGGGCGGPSYAFFATGQGGVSLEEVKTQNAVIAGGAGGSGGAGGLSLGNSGGSGTSGAYDIANF